MESKICPIMSCRGFAYPPENPKDRKSKPNPFIFCQKEECQLWEVTKINKELPNYYTGDIQYAEARGHCGLIKGE